MQGSFWKTVAVVGVIGVGSLAILEVQNQLSGGAGDSDVTEEEAAALAQRIADETENSVDPLLERSEFERMIEDAAADKPRFDLGEPEVADSSAGAFYGTESDDSVDTTVSKENLSGGNPFDREQPGVLAANFNGVESGGVVQVGLQADAETATTPDGENPFDILKKTPAVSQTETGQPFLRESDVPQTAGTEKTDAPFSLFNNDDEAATETASPPFDDESPERESSASQTGRAAVESQSSGTAAPAAMKFFGANDQDQSDQTTVVREESVQSTPRSAFPSTDESAEIAPVAGETRTTLAQRERTRSLQPTPDPGQSSAFASKPFDEEPAANRTTESGPFDNEPFDSAPPERQEFPSFDGQNSSPSFDRRETQPPAQQEFDSAPDDAVPAPQSPRPFEEDLSQTEGIPQPVPEFDTNDRLQPAPENNLRPGDSTLPFAEDLNGTENNSGSQTTPLSIPSRENSFPSRSDSLSGSQRRMESRDFDTQPRNFRTQPQQYPEDNRLESDDSRLMTQPRRLPDGSREFGNDAPVRRSPEFNFDDSPASRTISQSELRRVSGVMRPNLILQKTAPENATVGTPLQYKIIVRNEGDAAAHEVVVEDEVTAGAQVNSAHPQSEIDRATNKLIWRFARIDPGDTQEIIVQVTPTGEGTLDGVATVRFKARVKATTVITAPKLRLQMQGPDEVRLGDEVAYRYIITNEGSGEARNVFVRTVLPVGGGLKHPAGNDLEYEIKSLKPNEQREITLTVVAAEPGEARAEAEVSAAGGGKDQAAWNTKIVGAQLKIVRRGPRRRFVGRSATYENIVSNETNFDAVDAKVVEQVPVGMEYRSSNLGGRYDETSRTVTWRINRIAAGRQETLEIELMPTDSGTAESVVTVFENAGIRGEDHVSTTVVEDLHNVSAYVSQLDGPVAVGETFGFTISVDNRGTADATDVSLSVDVPDEIQVVGAGSREVQAKLLEGNIVQYKILVRIPPNEQQKFEVKLKGLQEISNGAIKASVRYKQMEEPLVVSESVTVYQSL